jgi:hypothetical protein
VCKVLEVKSTKEEMEKQACTMEYGVAGLQEMEASLHAAKRGAG